MLVIEGVTVDKKVRMADIAQALGISVVSVSKGLAGKDGVSGEMRAKILATAKEMGYTSKQQALTKDSGSEPAYTKSKTIGILSADHFFDDNTFYSNLYRELLKKCTEVGDFAIMELITPHAEQECILPAIVTEKKVDALIFMGEFKRPYLKKVIQCGLPYLFLDFYDDNMKADCVVSDNQTGGYLLARHLLDKGYREIGYVGSVNATSSNMDRYLGMTKALLEAGIEPKQEWRLEDRDEKGIFIPFKLPEEMPRAFLCNCDEVAFNLVEFLSQKGYKIPEDIAITGYDDYRFSMLSRPPLTSYKVNVKEMAATAIKIIRRKLNNKAVKNPKNIVPGTLIVREST